MSPWWLLVLGLFLGVGVQWLLDYGFWRKRRGASKLETELLRSKRQLQSDRDLVKTDLAESAEYRKRLKNKASKLKRMEATLKQRHREQSSMDKLMVKLGLDTSQGTAEALAILNEQSQGLITKADDRAAALKKLQGKLDKHTLLASGQSVEMEEAKFHLEQKKVAFVKQSSLVEHLQGALLARDKKIESLIEDLLAQEAQSTERQAEARKAQAEVKKALERGNAERSSLGKTVQSQLKEMEGDIILRDFELEQSEADVAVLAQKLKTVTTKLSDVQTQLIEEKEHSAHRALNQEKSNTDVSDLEQELKQASTQLLEVQAQLNEEKEHSAHLVQDQDNSKTDVAKQLEAHRTEIQTTLNIVSALELKVEEANELLERKSQQLVALTVELDQHEAAAVESKCQTQSQIEGDVQKRQHLQTELDVMAAVLIDLGIDLDGDLTEQTSLYLSDRAQSQCQMEDAAKNLKHQLQQQEHMLAQQTAQFDLVTEEQNKKLAELVQESSVSFQSQAVLTEQALKELKAEKSEMGEVLLALGIDLDEGMMQQALAHVAEHEAMQHKAVEQLAEAQKQMEGKQAQAQHLESQLQFLQSSVQSRDDELTTNAVSISDAKLRCRSLDDELTNLGLQREAEQQQYQLTLEDLQQKLHAEQAIVLDEQAQLVALNDQLHLRGEALEHHDIAFKKIKEDYKLSQQGASSLKEQLVQHSEGEATRLLEVTRLADALQLKEGEVKAVQIDVQNKGKELLDLQSKLEQKKGIEQQQNQLIEDIQQQLGEKASLADDRQARLKVLEGEYRSRGNDLEQKSYELSEAKAGAEEQFGLLSSLKDQIKQYKSDEDEQALLLSGLQMQINEEAPKINQLQESVSSLEASIKVRESDLLQRGLEVKQAGQQLQDRGSEIKALKSDAKTRDNQLFQSQKELSSIRATLGEGAANQPVSEVVGAMMVKMGRADFALKESDEQLAQYKTSLESREAEMNTLRSQLKRLRDSLTQRDDELDEKVGVVSDFRKKMQVRQTEMLVLKDQLSQLGQTKHRIKASSPDDKLTRIWGIDFQKASFLRKRGVRTFEQLAESSPEQINALLSDGGEGVKAISMEDLAWWATQAQLAQEGKWAEIEVLRKKKISREEQGQLRKILGVDEALEALLKARGISNYRQLSQCVATQVNDLLESVSSQYDGLTIEEIHQSWLRQAAMAMSHKWDELRDYQAKFKAIDEAVKQPA